MQRLNATHCRIGSLTVLDVAHEPLQPFIGNVRLDSDRADRQFVRAADVLQQPDGIVEKIHGCNNGESFPHLSRSTFPRQTRILPRMPRLRESSKLAKLLGANLGKLMHHSGLTGHGIATAAKRAGFPIDPKTVNNARNAAKDGLGKGDLTLATLEGLVAGISAEGVSAEPWQLLVPRFDPQRLPELRKRSTGPSPAKIEDGYLDELVGLWSKIKPGRRATLLHLAQEYASESGEAADPPNPPQASQGTR